jgi:hypothetical protein
MVGSNVTLMPKLQTLKVDLLSTHRRFKEELLEIRCLVENAEHFYGGFSLESQEYILVATIKEYLSRNPQITFNDILEEFKTNSTAYALLFDYSSFARAKKISFESIFAYCFTLLESYQRGMFGPTLFLLARDRTKNILKLSKNYYDIKSFSDAIENNTCLDLPASAFERWITLYERTLKNKSDLLRKRHSNLRAMKARRNELVHNNRFAIVLLPEEIHSLEKEVLNLIHSLQIFFDATYAAIDGHVSARCE